MSLEFRPEGLVTAAAGTTTSGSTRVALDGAYAGWKQVYVLNSGTTLGFIALGSSTVTCAVPAAGTPANGIPLPPMVPVVLDIPGGATHYAVIMASGTATVFVVAGVDC